MTNILAVMFLAGLLGGFGGYLARRFVQGADSGSDRGNPKTWIADLVIGVVAAFCIPIFLLITQSKLLDSMKADLADPTKLDWDLLYLGGYCLIAAFSSRAFMESISANILKQTREIKMQQDRLAAKQENLATKQENLAAKQEEQSDLVAEMDAASENLPTSAAAHPSLLANIAADAVDSVLSKLTNTDCSVVSALASDRYSRRSATGISKETGLTKTEVNLSLAKLEENGLVTSAQSQKTGSLLFQLTPLGWRVSEKCLV